MPFIYRRAQKVLVWLDWPDPHERITAEHPIPSLAVVPSFRVLRFIASFCQSSYWQRLWIVQEVGQARDLEIHFREGCLSWADFITVLQKHDRGAKLPLQLQKEREDKYGSYTRYGSYTMLNLMHNHEDKLCKDRRDKVYALIGLARDVIDSRYPVDHGTSLKQVYLDAIEYRNSDTSRSQHDILEFSQLARQLLGVFIEQEKQTEALVNSHILTEKPNANGLSDTVRVSAKFLGRVVCLGPTVEAVLSNAKETERWTSLILKRCVKVDQEAASKENDFFLARLEDFFSNSQNVVETFES
jgi:hypothetical protein